MASVLQLCRQLTERPNVQDLPGVAIRHFAGLDDVEAWLELRHRAFARQRVGVRQWTADNFAAELSSRWWWQPQRMWLAEASPETPLPSRGEAGRGVKAAGATGFASAVTPLPLRGEVGRGVIGGPANSSSQLVGSVTLALRGQPDDARPVVHWLMVLSAWRRRGIGRLLMAHLEAAAWDAGHRQVWLETHAAWEGAARFYESLGYQH